VKVGGEGSIVSDYVHIWCKCTKCARLLKCVESVRAKEEDAERHITEHSKTILNLSPLTTLGQETRQVYSTNAKHHTEEPTYLRSILCKFLQP